MKSYKDLGNRYIKYRKKRAVLAGVSMVLTTILIYIVCTLAVNLYDGIKAQVEEQYNFHAQIMSTTSEQRDKMREYVTVENVDFAHFEEATWFQDFHGGENIPVYYLDSFDQSTFNFEVVEGKLPANPQEILIYEGYLHRFEEDIKVGSTVTIEVCDPVTLEPVGLEEFTVSGIYNYENDILLGSTTSSFTLGNKDMDMVAYVRFNNSSDWNSSINELAKAVGVDTSKPGAYYVNETMELVSFRGDAVPTIAMILMVLVLVVYISMVMIRSLFTSNLNDNVTEFSILKAIGATDKKIKAIFRREVYIEGAIAFVIGIVISQILFAIAENVIKMYGVDFSFTPLALLFAFVVLYITISLAILEPFSVLKKVPIVEGIKANYAIGEIKNKKRGGKLFRIFGIEGEYAYKNMRRNSKSFWNGVASFTVSTLIMSLMVTAMINFSKAVSLDVGYADYKYDYYTSMISVDEDETSIKGIQNTFLGLDFIDRADAHYTYFYMLEDDKEIIPFNDEIERNEIRNYFSTANNVAVVELYTEDELEFIQKFMVDNVDVNVIRDGGIIVMGSCSYYNQSKEEMETVKVVDAEVGDKISVLKPDEAVTRVKNHSGYDMKCDSAVLEEFEIKGFCENTLTGNYSISIIMSYEYVTEKYGMDLSVLCDGFFLKGNDEFQVSDLAELERVVFGSARQENYEFFNEMMWMEKEMKSYLIVVYGIVTFVILMGIVSILNNMVNEYQVRRREVSILRSIGMSKKKLNKMLILEKVIMGLISWVLGTIMGCGLTRIFFIGIMEMYETTFIIPWLWYLVIGAGVIGIMVIISMFSVVSMGKMDITEGVRNQE